MRKRGLFHRNQERDFVRYRTLGYLSSLDAYEMLTSIHNEVADLVFLDPPFNLGKDYGNAPVPESLPSDQYEAYLEQVLFQCIRVMKPGASLFLYHLPYWGARFFRTLSTYLDFRHWIAVSMKNGFVRGRNLYPAHYGLLYFSKGEPRAFHRPKISPRICWKCTRQLKDYGGYQRIIEAKGLNLSDVWDDLSPVRHRAKKHRAANQLPIALTERVVSIAGRESGLLIDPFVGTGTSLVSATRARMNFIGNDLISQNIQICRLRLHELTLDDQLDA
jgi:site-specific DNA-methyltransferase (adenine-specific)